MEQRTIKELLELMLEHKKHFKDGLCNWIAQLNNEHIITTDEYWLLKKYINKNRPIYKRYNPYMLFNNNYGYYWIENFITPRISWIKKHIKILTK